jgi:uncharacterized protein
MSISEQLLYEFEPQESWLAHDSYFHGVGHLTRVFILQELICNQLEAEGVTINRQALRYASAAHDVGRHDDGTDPQHGQRSAKWIHDTLANQMSPETLDVATYIVHWHVPSDDEAPVMTTELKILKDADALDRVRLNDLNPKYLRTEAAKGLIDIARQLYTLSQPINPSSQKEYFETVLRAAKQLGLAKVHKQIIEEL